MHINKSIFDFHSKIVNIVNICANSIYHYITIATIKKTYKHSHTHLQIFQFIDYLILKLNIYQTSRQQTNPTRRKMRRKMNLSINKWLTKIIYHINHRDASKDQTDILINT